MTTLTTPRTTDLTQDRAYVATGAAAAAMISSGVGTLVLGLMTTGAVISEGLKNLLNWWNPAGPLTGKTGVAVIVWLLSWFLFNAVWKGKEVNLNRVFTTTMILIGLGLLFTFPPVFEAFE
jgi:hypothetical protein